MKVEEIIKHNQNKTVLFLGRVTNFTSEELTNFLESQGMNYADKYEGQDVALVVLSTMVTPLEEEVSYILYRAKIPEVRLSQFEEYYATHIKADTLMMSLKLSNDQERLNRLLRNRAFSDDVYLKLFKMYDWGSDGVYDNDDNRDITITFVERFYRPDGFYDHAMVYSPITLFDIAKDAKSANILDAILSMPNHEIKHSQRDEFYPKNLRETVALNPNISYESIRYLLSFNDDRIKSFLAANSAVGVDTQEIIFQKANDITKLMLTQNNALDDKFFIELLQNNKEIVASLLTFQKLTSKRLEYILEANLSDELLSFMGENMFVEEVADSLIGINKLLDYKLASNERLNSKLLTKLYEIYKEEIMLPLSANPNTPTELLTHFYNNGDDKVIYNLASNPNTSSEILKELCEMNSHDLNRSLALNSSVELVYLEQFALDSELIMLMKKNKTYLESINSAYRGMRSDNSY